jgi:hypothetical protein
MQSVKYAKTRENRNRRRTYPSTPIVYLLACNETTLMESHPTEVMEFVNNGFIPHVVIRAVHK